MSDPYDGPYLTADLLESGEKKELFPGQAPQEDAVCVPPEVAIAGDNSADPEAFVRHILAQVVDEVLQRSCLFDVEHLKMSGNAPLEIEESSTMEMQHITTLAQFVREEDLIYSHESTSQDPSTAMYQATLENATTSSNRRILPEIQDNELMDLTCLDSLGSLKQLPSGSKELLQRLSAKERSTASCSLATANKSQKIEENEQSLPMDEENSEKLESTKDIESEKRVAQRAKPRSAKVSPAGSRPPSGKDVLVAELVRESPSADQLRATLAKEFSNRMVTEDGKEYDLFWSTVGLLRRYEDPMRPSPSSDTASAPPESESEGGGVEDEDVAAAIDAIDALFPGADLNEDDDNDDEDDDEEPTTSVPLLRDDVDDEPSPAATAGATAALAAPAAPAATAGATAAPAATATVAAEVHASSRKRVVLDDVVQYEAQVNGSANQANECLPLGPSVENVESKKKKKSLGRRLSNFLSRKFGIKRPKSKEE